MRCIGVFGMRHHGTYMALCVCGLIMCRQHVPITGHLQRIWSDQNPVRPLGKASACESAKLNRCSVLFPVYLSISALMRQQKYASSNSSRSSCSTAAPNCYCKSAPAKVNTAPSCLQDSSPRAPRERKSTLHNICLCCNNLHVPML